MVIWIQDKNAGPAVKRISISLVQQQLWLSVQKQMFGFMAEISIFMHFLFPFVRGWF